MEGPVFGQEESSAKSKVVHLIGAVQTLLRSMYQQESSCANVHLLTKTVPLIGINILVIVYELLLG